MFAACLFAIAGPADGREIAYVTFPDAGVVGVIDVTAERLLRTVAVGPEPRDLVASPDGQLIFVASRASSTLSVIHTHNDTVIDTIPFPSDDLPNLPHALAVSDDGAHLYVGLEYEDGCPFKTEMRIIDLATGAQGSSGTQLGETSIEQILLHNGVLFAATAGGCSDYFYHSGLAVGTHGPPVTFLGEAYLSLGPSRLAIGELAFAQPDAIYAALPNENAVARIDRESLRRLNVVVTRIPVGVTPTALLASTTGAQLFVVNACGSDVMCRGPGTLSVVDTATGTTTTSITAGRLPIDVALSRDARRALVINGASEDLSIVDLYTRRVRETIALPAEPHQLLIVDVPEPSGCAPCRGQGLPGIDDMVHAVSVVLGERPTFTCPGLDADDSGSIDVADLVRAAGVILGGCPTDPR